MNTRRGFLASVLGVAVGSIGCALMPSQSAKVESQPDMDIKTNDKIYTKSGCFIYSDSWTRGKAGNFYINGKHFVEVDSWSISYTA